MPGWLGLNERLFEDEPPLQDEESVLGESTELELIPDDVGPEA